MATQGDWGWSYAADDTPTIEIPQNTLYAVALDATQVESGPVWITQFNVNLKNVRDAAAASRLRMALYDDNGGEPNNLLAYSDEIVNLTVNNNMVTRSTGVTLASGTSGAYLKNSGGRIWLVFRAYTQCVISAPWSANVQKKLTKTGYSVTGPPPAKIPSMTQGTAPIPSAWVTYITNTTPSITAANPDNLSTVATLTPTFTLNYSDADIGTRNDKILTARFSVTDTAAGATYPQEVTISTADQTDGQIAYTWGGATLARGRTYSWTAQVVDRAGTWSAATASRTFTISTNATGTVVVTSGTPVSKIESGSPSFTAQWVSSTGAMAKCEVQILVAGVVAQTSATVTKAASSGATFTVSFAESGLTTIPPGAYTWRARGALTGGAWSDWSDPVAFSVNSPANTPSNLQPSNASVSAIPRLSWVCSDPDLDDEPGVGVWGEVELTRPNGTVATISSIATIDSASRTLMYTQLTSTHVTGPGTYTWRARNWDRSADLAGYSGWSTPVTFTYGAAPTVTISQPSAQNVTTLTPAFTFTVSGTTIAQYEVEVADWPGTTAFYNSGRQTVTGSYATWTHTMPAGWLVNGRDYAVRVLVITASSQSAYSDPWKRITTALSAAEDLDGIGVNTVGMRRDFDESTVQVQWNQTTIASGTFKGYAIWRGEAKGRPLAVVRDPGRTSWLDHHAPGNRTLTYAISQLRTNNQGDVIQSAPKSYEARVELNTPVLASVEDPVNVRAAVAWLSDGLSWGFTRPAQTYTTWGSDGKPVVMTSPVNYGQKTVSLEVVVRSDERGTLEAHFDDFETLATSGHTFSFREGRNRMWCRVASWDASRSGVGSRSVRLELEEVAYTEGVALPK
jgi:hypothetical protein